MHTRIPFMGSYIPPSTWWVSCICAFQFQTQSAARQIKGSNIAHSTPATAGLVAQHRLATVNIAVLRVAGVTQAVAIRPQAGVAESGAKKSTFSRRSFGTQVNWLGIFASCGQKTTRGPRVLPTRGPPNGGIKQVSSGASRRWGNVVYYSVSFADFFPDCQKRAFWQLSQPHQPAQAITRALQAYPCWLTGDGVAAITTVEARVARGAPPQAQPAAAQGVLAHPVLRVAPYLPHAPD